MQPEGQGQPDMSALLAQAQQVQQQLMEAQEALSLRVELLSSKVDSLAGMPRQAGPGPPG